MVLGGIDYDDHIQGLERLAQAIHDVDSQCRLVAQIGHSGETVSPSGIKWPFPWKKRGRILSEDEVDGIVADFGDAIWWVKTAGLDGIELNPDPLLESTFLIPGSPWPRLLQPLPCLNRG